MKAMADIMELTEKEKVLTMAFAIYNGRGQRIFDCGRFDNFEPSEEAMEELVAVNRAGFEWLAQVAVKALRLADKGHMLQGQEFVDTLERIRRLDDMVAMHPPLDDEEDSKDKPVIL